MARKTEFTSEIIEFMGSLKENASSDWCKAVARIAWNDNPSTIDVRNMNMSKNIIGKGISLSDEDADRLVNLLVEHDYGSTEVLEAAVRRRTSRYVIEPVLHFDEEEVVITIDPTIN